MKIRPEKEKKIPYRPEFFSGLIFTSALVVHITARITFIHIVRIVCLTVMRVTNLIWDLI